MSVRQRQRQTEKSQTLELLLIELLLIDALLSNLRFISVVRAITLPKFRGRRAGSCMPASMTKKKLMEMGGGG